MTVLDGCPEHTNLRGLGGHCSFKAFSIRPRDGHSRAFLVMQWTNKLEGMFKDVQLSKEQMSKFNSMFDSDVGVHFLLRP